MSWKCNCGVINSGLLLPVGDISLLNALSNLKCIIQKIKPAAINSSTIPKHYPITGNTYDWHSRIVDEEKIKSIERKLWSSSSGSKLMASNTESEDLFSQFYNAEKVLISAMSPEDFRIHEETLTKIAFEAKARITAIVDKKREDNAKLKHSQKEWLLPRNETDEALVSDAINTVASRKKRMNKVEKLNEMLAGFVDEDTRKMLIQNVERKATDSGVSLISFVKVKENEAKVQENETKADETPKPIFDPTNLFKK